MAKWLDIQRATARAAIVVLFVQHSLITHACHLSTIHCACWKLQPPKLAAAAAAAAPTACLLERVLDEDWQARFHQHLAMACR